MNKQEYLHNLRFELKKNRVNDIDDIIEEYNQHFEQKLKQGETEEEIANKLAKPSVLAEAYQVEEEAIPHTKFQKLTTGIGLAFIDLFMIMFLILIFSCVLVFGIVSISLLLLSIGLITNVNISAVIPYFPYHGKLLFSIANIAFSILWAIGTLYSYIYSKQFVLVYLSWRKNIINQDIYSQVKFSHAITNLPNKRFKLISIISLIVFLSFSTIFMISMMSIAGFEFWHTWNWFQ